MANLYLCIHKNNTRSIIKLLFSNMITVMISPMHGAHSLQSTKFPQYHLFLAIHSVFLPGHSLISVIPYLTTYRCQFTYNVTSISALKNCFLDYSFFWQNMEDKIMAEIKLHITLFVNILFMGCIFYQNRLIFP